MQQQQRSKDKYKSNEAEKQHARGRSFGKVKNMVGQLATSAMSKIKPLRQLASREQSEEPVPSGINKIQTTKVNNRSYSHQRGLGSEANALDLKSKGGDGNVQMPPINRGLS